MRQKNFDRKSWSPPLNHKIFRYQKFSETQIRGVPLRKFSALWDKKILTENRDPPLLSIKFFDTRNFLKHRSEGFLYEIFRHCETKKFWQKIVIPPLLSIKFFDTRNFVKQRRVPLRSFSVLWDNKFSIENRDIPLLGKIIRYPKFSETQTGSSTKFFGTVRENFSTENRDTL